MRTPVPAIHFFRRPDIRKGPSTPFLRHHPSTLPPVRRFLQTFLLFLPVPVAAQAPDPYAILKTLERVDGPSLWPHFRTDAIPVAIYDGTQVLLYRHPAPPEGFSPEPGHSGVFVRPGPHPAVRANSSALLADVPTATLMLDGPFPDRDAGTLTGLAVHEMFHVFQRNRHPGWAANEADLFTYPVDDPPGYLLRRMETEVLRRALLAEAPDTGRCWARAALDLRGERFARLGPAYAAYERGTELTEGLALYVETQATPRADPPAFPAAGFAPEDVRARAYVSGLALARLLDREAPGWQARLEAADTLSLDALLASALASWRGAPCPFSPGDRTRFVAETDEAMADLSRRLAGLLRRFEEQPGWRIILDVPETAPLWPQAFDPLNVQRVPGGLLHTRMLRLDNDLGTFDMLAGTAFTEAVGDHPLFTGVRRVVVTGLGAAPEITWEAGKVSVQRGDTLLLTFRQADVEQTDQTVHVQVRQSP